MSSRGIRGAITVEADLPDKVTAATQELLQGILAANPTLSAADVAFAFFTVTDDIVSAYPAQAARQMGWEGVPMLCGREIPVPGGLPLCIRILIVWNTDLAQSQVRHVYLRQAACLRPDWATSSLATEGRKSL
ncbi:MAG: chorismate mutase [Anaerolineales bacterium]